MDIVRDLMDPLGKEESYKSGMRKDKDGFMDISWCKSKPAYRPPRNRKARALPLERRRLLTSRLGAHGSAPLMPPAFRAAAPQARC